MAILVCGFAVGMAGLLNHFKYRSTSEGLITERLVVTGRSVENAIQSSLALGLQFSDIGTLPPAQVPVETLKRFSYQIRMPAAKRLNLPPPLPMLSYAELIHADTAASQ